MVDNPLNVKASLYAARHGYELVEEIKFDKPKLACAEGHVIKKGYVFAGEGKKIILGGTCQWKVFLFKRWENITYEEITDILEDIGKMFWIAERDGMWNDIYSIVKAENINMDFTNVPAPEKQEWFKDTLGKIIKRIIATRKAEEKRKVLELAKEKKRSCTAITDKDYLMLKAISTTGSQSMDAARLDLLKKFEMYRKWTANQRAYVLKMIERSGTIKVQPVTVKMSKEISVLFDLVKKINKESYGFVKEFTDTMIMKNMRNLSVNQRNKLIQIVGEYLGKKDIDLGFDHAAIVFSLNP